MSPSSPTHDRYSAARALRALRPLRTIRMLPKLKQQVNTIMTSLPLLLDVMLLAVFVLVVWGTLGLQLFKGKLRYRCLAQATQAASAAARVDEIPIVCH